MESEEFETLSILKYLENIRGRHTELVTVYVPAGFSLDLIRNQLSDEKNTATNIKDRNNRKNVIEALEKISSELRLIRQTPKNGLVLFCGNVSDREGEPDIKLWSIEPPEKSDIRMYRCDQHFITDPLKSMFKEGKTYGLLVIDNREATFGLLEGTKITMLKHLKSLVPGKFSKGGQSAMRFSREREGLIRDFYKQVAETAKQLFFTRNLHGILIGGPGPAKDNFIESGYIITDLKNRIKGIQSTSYTDETGLEELLEKSHDILATERITIERKYVQQLLGSIARNDKMSVYGENAVKLELDSDNVNTLLISDGLEEKKKNDFYYLGKQKGVKIEFISKESGDGLQFFNLGGLACFLKKQSRQ